MHLCGFEAGLDRPFFLIAGPCVIESRELALETAGQLKELTASLGIPFIYKSSYDKANRSSGASFRGPGLDEGLKILAEVRRQIGVPVLTDVHDIGQIAPVAAVVDAANRQCNSATFTLGEMSYRVYVRHAADLERVAAVLATQLGAAADLVFVLADICRADLLLEIEATAIHATAR